MLYGTKRVLQSFVVILPLVSGDWLQGDEANVTSSQSFLPAWDFTGGRWEPVSGRHKNRPSDFTSDQPSPPQANPGPIMFLD